MDFLIEGFIRAWQLIISFDEELIKIVLLSLKVSGLALALSTFAGLPVAAILGSRKIPSKSFIVSVLNTLMGLPPVVVGLFVYLMLSRSGPLGFMGLLYTSSAMVIAQVILSFPIVVSLCHSAITGVDPLIKQTAITLGASGRQAAITVIKEARYGIMSAVIAAFGRLTAEVGAILIVGGNIAGYTRVMTTTIALEADKGNFELALALGLVLLCISLIVNVSLHFVQQCGLLRHQT